VSARRTDWLKLVSVWNRVVHFISDPQTQPEALRIMSARVGLTPEAYLPLLRGTRLLTLDEGRKVFERRPALDSIFGSSQSADGFNVRSGVYHTAQNVGSYIDASLLNVAR
jgi:NitT/TauT family transport system substrate-binding protein